VAEIFSELLHSLENTPVINTHSHSLRSRAYRNFNLDKVLENSYVNWNGIPVPKTYEGRVSYLEKNRFNSYFLWLEKALQKLFRFSEPLSAANWDEVSKKVAAAYETEAHHLEILRRQCRYEKIILDTFWRPGEDNGEPELFAPSFRINVFLFGYSPTAKDHNGHSIKRLFQYEPRDLAGYISFLAEQIRVKKKQGCVALKCATAYERDLNFRKVTRRQAEAVFKKKAAGQTDEDIRNFQDYIFWEICRIAAELDLPLQCHTGMGLLGKSRALGLKEVIEGNPKTKFVLLHCGYPWLADVNGLLRTYPNVYPDLSWLPLLSTAAAVRALAELLDGGTGDKICWGCDTFTPEESYGALLAARFVFAQVAAKRIKDGRFSWEDALALGNNLFYKNAAALYGLK